MTLRNTSVCYNDYMAGTLSIRLADADRQILELAARRRGTGLSSFVRMLAEEEASRLRRAAIRADGERVVAHLTRDADVQAELESFGTPLSELP